MVFADQQLTYRQLNNRANQLAHYLRNLGVKPDTLIGLCVERSLLMIVGVLGILKAGGAYVPLDPDYPTERLAYMLKDSQVSVLLSQEKLLTQNPGNEARVVCLDTDWEEISTQSKANLINSSTIDNLAYVIYTSGSTGQPKGILVNHSNVVRLFAATAVWYHFNQDDVWTMFHSYAFDFSVWEIWGALLYGGKLVVVPYMVTRSPESFYQLLAQEKVTVLNQTPSAFRQLIQAEQSIAAGDDLNLRLVIFGGEALEINSLQPWFERHGDQNPQLVNMYGITETTVHVTYRLLSKGDLNHSVSVIGRPISDLQVYVLDEHQQSVPIGVPGEMYVGGAGVARGYLNRPELTEQRFISHHFSNNPQARLYKTGDLARYLPNGELEYLGRIDNQVKIRGFRIELGEIEALLASHPAVWESVVVVREDEPGDKRLVAYVVSKAEQSTTTVELRRFLTSQLPSYMVPSTFVQLEALPLTANGKIDRRALPEPDTARPELKNVFVAPTTPEEKILAAIWMNILGIEQVGINDNFFALGGDSIRSIQILSQAKEQGLSFSVQQLFQHQTIHELVQELKTQENDTTKLELTQPFNLISEADKQLLPDGLEDAYPLAMLQMGMVYHSEYNKDGAFYHDIFSLHLKTSLDIQLLQVTVQDLVNRHTVLRTSFELSKFSIPLQLVHQQVEIPLQVEDWCHLNDSEHEVALTAWFEAEKKRPFDWTRPPLVRFCIHRRTPETFNLTVSFHHAILDGWSLASMMSELLKHYLSLLGEGVEHVSPPLGITFRDFIALEQQALASPETQRYWSEKLNNSTFTKLPRWSFMPTNTDVQEIGVQEVTLSPEIFIGLKQLAQSAEAPLKNVLLTAHLRVLNFLSGEEDVVTGVVANGRPEQSDGERVLGLFLNTLPFRLKLAGGTWIDLVKQVFAVEQEMLPHRRYPLVEIQRSVGNESLFETAFNFTHFHVYEQVTELDNLQALGGKAFDKTNFTFLAQFSVSPSSDEIVLTLKYDLDELCFEQIGRISDYYLRVLAAMANEPQGLYEMYSLVSLEERHQLLVEWNQTAVDYPLDKCIHQLFEEQVERTPHAVAVEFGNQQLTYRELNARANQLSHYLRKLGVEKDVLVGICLQRSFEMVVGLLGILKAGGAYVPLDPDYPQERLDFMLSDAQVQVLLTQQQLVHKLSSQKIPVVCLDRDWNLISLGGEENSYSCLQTENLAYVIYTSGSTGQPKGVAMSHLALVNLICWQQQTSILANVAKTLQFSPISFDVSFQEIFSTWCAGGTLVLISETLRRDPIALLSFLEAAAVERLFLPFIALQQIAEVVEGSPAVGSHLRELITAGEQLQITPAITSWLQKLPECTLHNHYGPSESHVVTAFTLKNTVNSSVALPPIGRPIANTQIYLLDQSLQPVPVGVPGELYIGGVCLARNYFHRPDLTALKFIPNPFNDQPGTRLYKTGDLARYLPDGNIEYLGRIDNQVKIRGFRIEFGEVESALSQHPEVLENVVIIREDVPGNKRLVAYLVSHTSQTLTISNLRSFLSRKLPEYMIPSAFVFLSALPVTPNGKVDRRNLPAPELRLELESNFVAPRTPIEEMMAHIWADVLGVELVGIDDNFFELGGHSLLATQLISRMRGTFNVELPLRSLFENSTIAELADVVLTKFVEQAESSTLDQILHEVDE
ncbi:amino acid adenylation domain-containing protein [Nostoc sp. NIES-4103]|nr:amino acid adenylation domain-containing protein [Nostoc sp. NIES-4103]